MMKSKSALHEAPIFLFCVMLTVMDNESMIAESPLNLFKNEMQQLAEAEAAEGKTAHFQDIILGELTDADRLMWEMINADWQKAMGEVRVYQNAIPLDQKSRRGFAAFLNNVLMRKMRDEMINNRRPQ
jgi:hypothetical protein